MWWQLAGCHISPHIRLWGPNGASDKHFPSCICRRERERVEGDSQAWVIAQIVRYDLNKQACLAHGDEPCRPCIALIKGDVRLQATRLQDASCLLKTLVHHRKRHRVLTVLVVFFLSSSGSPTAQRIKLRTKSLPTSPRVSSTRRWSATRSSARRGRLWVWTDVCALCL